MPEMPEVEQLAIFLRLARGRTRRRRYRSVAINVLKTYDPPPSSLAGMTVDDVTRHGKFLDLEVGGLHLVMHLSRAGWLPWKKAQPTAPARPGKGPLALRVMLDDGTGFDVTEAGTQKRLAVYVVRDPAEVPGIARLGIDPLDPEFTPSGSRGPADGGRPDQGRADRPVAVRRCRQRLLRRGVWAARLSPFKPAANLTDGEVAALYDALTGDVAGGRGAGRGPRGRDLKAEKKAGLDVHARTGLPCPRCGDEIRQVSFADKSLQYCATCQTGGKPLADRRLSKLLK